MKKSITLFLWSVIILFGACSPTEPEAENNIAADELGFTVSFDESFSNTLYPSMVLGISNYMGQDDYSFLDIKIEFKNPLDEYDLKVILAPSILNKETIDIQSLKGRRIGNSEVYHLPINWDNLAIGELDEPGTVDLEFSATIDGKLISTQTLKLSHRTINECVYVVESNGGKYSMAWMFGAYVNEDHPLIETFLQEALSYGVINSFVGYQGTSVDVSKQVAAIWYTLQKQGIKYSNITNTSKPGDNVWSQHVRFFDEVYKNNQANCVDGSVFLASILMKIGIKPILVLLPGHMYIGYYTNTEKTELALLETTMVGNIKIDNITDVSLPNYLDYLTQSTYDGYINNIYTLDQVKQEISWYQFEEASFANIDDYNGNIPAFNNPIALQYQVFDIDELRQIVQPIQN